MKHMIKKGLAAVCAAVLLCAGFAPGAGAKAVEAMSGIAVRGQRFVDAYGRTRIFHGINYVIGKQGPAEALDEDYFANCAARGFNVLRLGLYWAELEPRPDVWDEAYLASIDPIFDAAAAHGVYIMLELHQDLFGRAAAGYGGWGAPEWACLTDGAKLKQNAMVWAEGYFWGKGVHNAFDNFWNNSAAHGKGLQDHYAEMWAMLAQRYGEKPALLGYDFFNEPHPGKEGGKVFRSLVGRAALTAISHPIQLGRLGLTAVRGETLHLLDFLDGKFMRQITRVGDKRTKRFDEERYAPFFEKMTGAVRGVHPGGVVFMENSYFSNLGVPYAAQRPRVGGAPEPNAAFAPHGYDLVVDTAMYDNPGTDRVKSIFEEHRRAQQRLEMPVLVGEWGGEWGGPRWQKHCEDLLDLFDSYGWSNAYYAVGSSWKWFSYRGKDFLARPYPMAVNGGDLSFAYQKDEKRFSLTYTQPEDADAGQPTILYLPLEGTVEAGDLAVEIVPLHSEALPGACYVYLTGSAGAHRMDVRF